VKAHLSELADRVEGQHDRILVTRNGRPSFVVMSLDDLESLEESLNILCDDELMESLRRSRQQAAQGPRRSLRRMEAKGLICIVAVPWRCVSRG
jgi:prevent-host-death family protein